jgi:hypothetical protein
MPGEPDPLYVRARQVTDADLTIDPAELHDSPLLAEL